MACYDDLCGNLGLADAFILQVNIPGALRILTQELFPQGGIHGSASAIEHVELAPISPVRAVAT
jgi:hypothetical protein